MAERLPPSSAEFDPLKGASLEPTDLEISARQRRLWSLFQHTATSLTHLYKSKSKCQNTNQAEDQESWLAFQSAASALTSLYRESADILASLEKPSSRVSSATVTSSDLSLSSLRTSSNNLGVVASTGKQLADIAISLPTSKPPANSSSTDVMTSVESEEDMMTNSTSNPPPPAFDFISCSRFKRSWSPWPDEPDMDHFGGANKRRKFL